MNLTEINTIAHHSTANFSALDDWQHIKTLNFITSNKCHV